MNIKLIILDIDGVMTDGTKVYDIDGRVIAKSFHDHDLSAIKILSEKFNIVFLSRDNRVNKRMAINRDWHFIHADHNIDKSYYLQMLCHEYNCTYDEIVYVGDDVHDVELLKKVGYPFCPYDAVKEVQEVAFTLNTRSGKGVIKELSYLLEG